MKVKIDKSFPMPCSAPVAWVFLQDLEAVAGCMPGAKITERLDVGQSTTSHHLAKLAEVGFVHVERIGTSSHWRVNERCLSCFPSAAEVVMGRIAAEFTDAMEESR